MPSRRSAAAASSAAHKGHGHGHHEHDPHGPGAHGAHHRENSREHHREGTGLSHREGTGSDKGGPTASAPSALKKSSATALDDRVEGRKFPPPTQDGERPGDESMAFGSATATAPSRQELPRAEARDTRPAGGGVQIQWQHHDSDANKSRGERLKAAFMNKLRAKDVEKQWNPLYGDTKIAAKVCTHPFFEPVCLLVICFNALWIGYSVDQEDPDGGKQPYMYRMADNFFCFFFSGVIIVRIAAYRNPLSFIFDPKL